MIIGVNYQTGHLGKCVEWRSGVNFGEADTVLIGPEAIWEAINSDNPNFFNFIFKELMSSVERGLNLIILLDEKYNYSVYPTLFKISAIPPFTLLVKTNTEKGSSINETHEFSKYVKSTKPYMEGILGYDIVFKETNLIPILKAGKGHDGPDKIIAGFKKIGRGIVLFMPSKTTLTNIAHTQILKKLVNEIQLSNNNVQELEWVKNFCFPEENNIRLKIENNEKQIQEIKQRIIKLNDKIKNQFLPLKSLFTTSDIAFEEAVKEALISIGYNAVLGPTGHADILAYNGSTLLAIEAKGINSAIKEGHIAQASKWTTEVDTVLSHEEEDITDEIDIKYLNCLKELGIKTGENRSVDFSKGVAICNTYCKKPLDKRNDNFAIKVPENLRRRHIFALTGLQLLGVVIAVKNNPKLKEKYQTTFAETEGVFEEYNNYNEILHKKNETVNENVSNSLGNKIITN